MQPHLIADVTLYETAAGGRIQAALPGWGCPCVVPDQDMTYPDVWDALFQLGDEPLRPGEKRRVGLVFLTPEGAEKMRRAGRFLLWEGRIIGEARVVQS
jgi:hypothetical protein